MTAGGADRPTISIREFARREKVDEKEVRRKLESGHLKAGADGRPFADQVDAGWHRPRRGSRKFVADIGQMSADPDQVVAAADAFVVDVLAGRYAGLAEAERVKMNALALKHMIDARKRAGGLVDRQAVLDAAFKRARSDRDAWLNWPSRVGPIIAAELGLEGDTLSDVLAAHVHQHLVDLGEPELDFDGDDTG